ncbi:MAG: hypothetical protein AB8B71_20235 [Paracoccaceae bacterium]
MDVDLLADAFVTFAEELFDHVADNVAKETFSWTEVTHDEFDQACQRLLQNPDRAYLNGVWADGKLGVVALPGHLTRAQRTDLFEELIVSQSSLELSEHNWQMVETPIWTWPIADRRQPILATSEQLTYLHLGALQEDGKQPTVVMPRIFLDSPNVEAFEAAFEVLQERHEILHMSFVEATGQTFIRLQDELDFQFSSRRANRLGRKIEQLASRTEVKLAASLKTTGPLWAAALIQRGPKAVVVCVLSEAIADPNTAVLLREEILELYAWFKDGPKDDPKYAGPKMQFVDIATAGRDRSQALTWWDTLQIQTAQPDEHKLSEAAPVVSWQHSISPELSTRIEDHNNTAQSLLFYAFLECLNCVDEPKPAWVLTRSYTQRPKQFPQVLGQFSLDVPIWLGDLSKRTNLNTISLRLAETLDRGALSAADLAKLLPNSLPARMPYLFDWRPLRPSVHQLALQQDITFRAWRDGGTIKTQWDVRRDHPLSLNEQDIQSVFQTVLSRTIAV